MRRWLAGLILALLAVALLAGARLVLPGAAPPGTTAGDAAAVAAPPGTTAGDGATPVTPAAGAPAPAGPAPAPPEQPDGAAIARRMAEERAMALGPAEKNLARRLPRRVQVKGIYLTAHTVVRPDRFAELLDLVDRTELNAMVIDVKSDWGTVQYDSALPAVKAAGALDQTRLDLRTVLRTLKEHRVYTIARVVTFKDNYAPRRRPELGVQRVGGGLWQDYNGLTWLNPYERAAWEYVVDIAKEVAALGFEEIQFDYVRFPSDGPMGLLHYPGAEGTRSEAIGDFLQYAREQLEPLGVWVAADIFGIVLSVADDQGIGQQLEEMARGPHILSPMLYPSHYGPGNLGLPNPNAAPYETILRALGDAAQRLSQQYPQLIIRPWLQDFSMGHPYGPAEVRAQIQGTYDNQLDGWMLWNAANVYTAGALDLQEDGRRTAEKAEAP